ncbi:MAG: DUF547 domain-containing protein [Acidobacteriota bacterium]
MKLLAASLILALGLAAPGRAALPDPAPFDAVLTARARGGGFDYRGANGQDRKRLAAYLANLGDARPSAMTPDERKAFYVNAYNAMAIGIVLERYPIKSIRDVNGAFRKIERKIGGDVLSLDAIEDKLRALDDPRFHFAIVCVSESCPPLTPRAYTAQTISAAFERQGRAFVNDPKRNAIDRAKGRVALSKIFDWNRKEFERDAGSVSKYVARYVPDRATAAWLASGTQKPDFLEYNWALNQR